MALASSPHPLGEGYSPAVKAVASTSRVASSPEPALEGLNSSQDRRSGDKATRDGGARDCGTPTRAQSPIRREGKGRDLESAPGGDERAEAGESDDLPGDAGPSSSATPTRPLLAVLPSQSDSTGLTLDSLQFSRDPAEPSPSLSVLSNPPMTSALPSPSDSTRPILSFSPPSNPSQSVSATNSAGSGLGLGSWKSRSGKLGATLEKKRLAALGFEEELSRDYDFWASAGLTVCNIGGFPGSSNLSVSLCGLLQRMGQSADR